MIDVQAPGSPGWWLARLHKKLADRRPSYQLLDDYYTGAAACPTTASRVVANAAQRLLSMSRTNFAELVVEAVRERMVPVAFRTGAESDEQGDREALRIWQANSLDADNTLVHRSSLTMGVGFVIVGPPEPDIEAPLITVEDPRECAVAMDPRRRRRVRAAIKVFKDDDTGLHNAYVYVGSWRYRAVARGDVDTSMTFDPAVWTWADEGQRGPVDTVPVVPFPNKANTFGHHFGEFQPHLPILDRINFTVMQRLEVATLQAFRQRAVKGLDDADENGEPIDYANVFESAPGALWQLPETADIWESQQVDLSPIRQAIRDDVQDLAAVTRTPLFYLTPEANNGSAEGASLAREGLVFKAEDRIKQATECWEQVMSLAFQFAGDEVRARRSDIEVLWAPVERFSLAERYDAASKAASAGVPWANVMADVLQFSPQAVQRMASERSADALLTAALAQTATGAAQTPPTAPAEVTGAGAQ